MPPVMMELLKLGEVRKKIFSVSNGILKILQQKAINLHKIYIIGWQTKPIFIKNKKN